MKESLFVQLKQQIKKIAVPVGFIYEEIPTILEDVNPPTDTLVLLSSFALIALVPIKIMEREPLEDIVQQAIKWMLRRLALDEQRAKFIDGYLLFALPEVPNDELRPIINKIITDTTVCRKQIVWPSINGDWSERLYSVTVLGLPLIENTVNIAIDTPQMPSTAERALEFYKQRKSYETAAEMLRKEAHLAANKEV